LTPGIEPQNTRITLEEALPKESLKVGREEAQKAQPNRRS
jgi:hypothetical protein